MVSEVYALLFQGRVWEVYFCASEIHNECSFYLIVIDVLLRHVSTILSYLTCFSTMMLVYQEGFMLSFYKAKRCLFFFFFLIHFSVQRTLPLSASREQSHKWYGQGLQYQFTSKYYH